VNECTCYGHAVLCLGCLSAHHRAALRQLDLPLRAPLRVIDGSVSMAVLGSAPGFSA
jgi:hypothetical protein